MRARVILVVLTTFLVACKSNPSKLDHAFEDKSKSEPRSGFGDPWAKSSSNKDDDDKGGGLGGFDLQGILAKIKDTI